ncbi:MAG: SIS domain-containing protein [Kiritimatiellia bacterium]
MKDGTHAIFDDLFTRYPMLDGCRSDIAAAFDILLATYRAGGKVMVCGNGGSASDSEHLVGELLKRFRRHRDIPETLKARLRTLGAEGERLAERLEGALAAVSLVSMTGILTAFANDVGWDDAYAQQLLGLTRPDDTLVVLSTSGNARNCIAAAVLARALGVKSIALTGSTGGRLRDICDVTLRMPATETYRVQEYHLPVYHALCAMLEAELF